MSSTNTRSVQHLPETCLHSDEVATIRSGHLGFFSGAEKSNLAAIQRHAFLGLIVTCLLVLSTVPIGCSSTHKDPEWLNFASDNSVPATPIPWHTDYESAVSVAQQEGKVLMLWFTGSDWCKFCTFIEDEVFETSEFHQWQSENVVPVLLDFPQQAAQSSEVRNQNESLRKKYEKSVKSYPTALFVNPDGQVLGKLGYMRGGPEPWIRQADLIMAVSL